MCTPGANGLRKCMGISLENLYVYQKKAFFSPVTMNSSQCTEFHLMFLMPITSEKKRKLEKKGKLEKKEKIQGKFSKMKNYS